MLPLAMPRPLVVGGDLPTPILPALGMDFMADSFQRLNNGSLETFDFASVATTQRSSSATYYDANGVLQSTAPNTPRFDHYPSGDNAPRGLLIEPSATNLVLQSENLDSSSWVKNNATITSNSTTAPDGNLTADHLVEDTSSIAHQTFQTSSFVAGQQYCFSTYAKAGGREKLWLNFNQALFPVASSAFFDLTAGAVELQQSGADNAYIENIGDGWYRCCLIATAVSSGNTGIAVRMALNDLTFNYVGDGSSGIYIWGSQLETGAAATSYIHTNGTVITRDEDIITMPWTFGLDGTFQLRAKSRDPNSAQAAVAIDNGSSGNQLRWFFRSTEQLGLVINFGGSTVGNLTLSMADPSMLKTATRVATNDIAISSDGQDPIIDMSASIPTATTLRLGNQVSSLPLNGWVEKLIYWPAVFDDAKIKALSTAD